MTATLIPGVTEPRRHALEVLYRAADCAARESNETSHADRHGAPTLYWQTLRWLTRRGYVTPIDGRPSWYRLTDSGVGMAEKVIYGAPIERGKDREHHTVYGAPKVAYDTEAAAVEAIAALVERDPDAELDAYLCGCGRWHVGNPGPRHEVTR